MKGSTLQIKYITYQLKYYKQEATVGIQVFLLTENNQKLGISDSVSFMIVAIWIGSNFYILEWKSQTEWHFHLKILGQKLVCEYSILHMPFD